MTRPLFNERPCGAAISLPFDHPHCAELAGRFEDKHRAGTLQKAPPTHREVQPVKECATCGAYLRSYGNEAFCDPCSKPSLTKDDHAEIFHRISEMTDVRERRRAFEALADLAGEAD